MCDVKVINQGSLIGIMPRNRRADTWLEECCSSEPWQWLGNVLYIDARMAGDVISAMIEDGLNLDR